MRREHHVGQTDEFGGRCGLALVHVEARTGDGVGAQRLGQRGGVHHAATRDIDQPAAFAQRLQNVCIDQVARARPAGGGDDEHIAPRGQGLQAVEVAIGQVALGAAVAVAHLHLKAQGALRDLAADGAQAQDAQALVRDVGRQRQRGAPHTFAGARIELHDAAHGGNE